MAYIPATGARESASDVRTFSYPTKAYPKQKGGTRYPSEFIEDQSKEGICTAISLTQNAHRALGIKFSADFQYLIQKKLYDGDWNEGSSIFNALRAAKGIGLLPESEWTHTTQADRLLPYDQYIAKLQAIPQAEITRLMTIAMNHKIYAYASVPVNRDAMAAAIDEAAAGIIVRFNVGQEWWTDKNGKVTWDKDAIQPLRKPSVVVSGHAITESNYDGNSFRVANTWGPEWADLGTAYHLLRDYAPTECWIVYFKPLVTDHPVQQQLDARSTWTGKLLDLIQKFLGLFAK